MTTSQAGCFERHLLRRRNDPLFPRDRQSVSTAELGAATERDRAERQVFEAQVTNLLGRLIDSPDSIGGRQAVDLLQEFHRLSVSVCQADQGLDEELAALITGYKELSTSLQGVHESAESEQLAAAAQSLYDQLSLLRAPLMAVLSRPESPMRHDELVPSMLRLSLPALSACLDGIRLLNAEVLSRSVAEGLELIDWAGQHGVVVDQALDKRHCLSAVRSSAG